MINCTDLPPGVMFSAISLKWAWISASRCLPATPVISLRNLNRGKNCHILDTFYVTESEVAQSCPALCDPVNCSMPGSSLSMEFSRQESWSGLPLPSPGDLPNPGIKPRSPALAGGFFTTEPHGKPSVGDVSLKKKKKKSDPKWSQLSLGQQTKTLL